MTLRAALLLTMSIGTLPSLAPAQTPPPAAAGRAEVRAMRVERPPVIDGVLDDPAWTTAPIDTGDWSSYNPGYGDTIPQRTWVWTAYDDDYFYFAFKCDDPDPSGIKTSISRRDNFGADDWVGLSLDSLGSGQLSYHMMVNPSGIQLDLLNSVAGGEDSAPDWIWDSAGHATPTGYSVEIRLPLQSIRFKGGTNVRMGILFWRHVSRLGMSVSWPVLEPGKWVFERNASLVVPDLQPRPTRELIPSATFSSRDERRSPTSWAGLDNTGDVGLSTKVGLTPTITLDATVNPDFSQVESDAFQVQVNQRFPIFFSEKRPFFMEGAGLFTLAGTQQGDQSLYTAVNTRTIIDPIAGAKITGSAGRTSFATLTAVDEARGVNAPGDRSRTVDRRVFNVARAQYQLKPASYVGAIVTDVESAGHFNRVAGLDVSYKVTPSQTLNVFALESASRRDDATRTGFGAQVKYSYDSRTWAATGQVEHYDRAFQMDTAFQNRVGETNGWGYLEYNFYPDRPGWTWIRRLQPFTFNTATEDRIQGGNEFLSVNGIRLFLTRSGFFRFDVSHGHEPWLGQRFGGTRYRIQSNAQLLHWLGFHANAYGGAATFYDEVEPFQGRTREYSVGVTLQPNGRFTQEINFDRVAFDRVSTSDRVYTVHILNTKTAYQFTAHFFLRAIVQFDNTQHRVLTDTLASYEPHPGTVFYAGYGSLIEQRRFDSGQWIQGEGNYLTTTRGLFLKASYLLRF